MTAAEALKRWQQARHFHQHSLKFGACVYVCVHVCVCIHLPYISSPGSAFSQSHSKPRKNWYCLALARAFGSCLARVRRRGDHSVSFSVHGFVRLYACVYTDRQTHIRIHTYIYIYIHRQTDREPDRQTDRHTHTLGIWTVSCMVSQDMMYYMRRRIHVI